MKNIWKAMIAWGTGVMLSAGFWGIVFPQYTFTTDCVEVVEEKDRNDVEGTERSYDQDSPAENLYFDIGSADTDHIHIKCSILEWIGEKKE